MADKSAEEILQMTHSQLKAMGKEELIALVTGTAKELEQKNKQTDMLEEINERMKKLETKVDTIPDAVAEIKANIIAVTTKVTELETAVSNHSTELDALKPVPARIDDMEELTQNNFRDIYKTMNYIQRFAEGLDARQRGRNIIMMGVSETSDELGDDDTSRVKNIIEKTSAMAAEDVGETTVKRLGDVIRNGRARPLLVMLEDHAKQWKVLQNSKNLKDVTGYSNIYIKKDIHPTINYELNRLRRREKELKEDHANRGVNIQYDYKARVITRDGIVIDRFNPSFQ